MLIIFDLAYLAYNAHNYDRIYQGVSVLHVDIGGLTPDEALDRLNESLGAQRLPDVAIVVGDDKTFLSMADLGGRLDLPQTVVQAYRLGRGGVLLPDVAMRLRLLWQGYDLVPTFEINQATAELALRPLARRESNPSRRTRLIVSGLEAHVQAAESGREVDAGQTVTAITRAVEDALGLPGWQQPPRALTLARGERSGGDAFVASSVEATLVFSQTEPPLSEVAGALQDVTALMGSPLLLTWASPDGQGERQWLLDQATLASWLTLSSAETDAEPHVALNQAAVASLVETLQTQIDRPASSGRFGYDAETETLTVLTPEQAGYALDVPESIRLITAAALSADRQVELPVATVAPPVSEAELRALLPLELLGEGTTQFVGSTASRQANIVTSARLFEGATLAAGATFSFLDVLGPVNRATGYEDAWVIYGNRTELGPGGGVCQVATTCFRAAFWAGLPIIERHPHAYRVSWYEPPLGLDASVFEPYVDLQFTNDYAQPLLIGVVIDEQAQTLAFRFYGRADGRKVTMTEPETSNPQPAPEPVYEEDETLAAGQQVQIERAHEGLDVSLVRQVQWPDGQQDEYLLTSKYAPWPARYLVGPTTTPTGE